MIKLRSSKKTATFAPSAICNTRSQRKNSHFSPSRASEVFRITTRAEDKHITNFGQDDGLAMHPASTAVIAQQAKDSRESLLPGLCYWDQKLLRMETYLVTKFLRSSLPLQSFKHC